MALSFPRKVPRGSTRPNHVFTSDKSCFDMVWVAPPAPSDADGSAPPVPVAVKPLPSWGAHLASALRRGEFTRRHWRSLSAEALKGLGEPRPSWVEAGRADPSDEAAPEIPRSVWVVAAHVNTEKGSNYHLIAAEKREHLEYFLGAEEVPYEPLIDFDLSDEERARLDAQMRARRQEEEEQREQEEAKETLEDEESRKAAQERDAVKDDRIHNEDRKFKGTRAKEFRQAAEKFKDSGVRDTATVQEAGAVPLSTGGKKSETGKVKARVEKKKKVEIGKMNSTDRSAKDKARMGEFLAKWKASNSRPHTLSAVSRAQQGRRRRDARR